MLENKKSWEMNKSIKEWELEKGIKLVNTNGFPESKSIVYSKKYSENIFRIYAKRSNIKCKTEKGFRFLNKI